MKTMKYNILRRYYTMMIAWHRAKMESGRRQGNVVKIMFHVSRQTEYTRKRNRLTR